MRSNRRPFFGIIRTTLVREGGERGGFDRLTVYREMLLQVCRDYSALPDPRTLTAAEIRFYYDGLRAELKHHTKPRAQ